MPMGSQCTETSLEKIIFFRKKAVFLPDLEEKFLLVLVAMMEQRYTPTIVLNETRSIIDWRKWNYSVLSLKLIPREFVCIFVTQNHIEPVITMVIQPPGETELLPALLLIHNECPPLKIWRCLGRKSARFPYSSSHRHECKPGVFVRPKRSEERRVGKECRL